MSFNEIMMRCAEKAAKAPSEPFVVLEHLKGGGEKYTTTLYLDPPQVAALRKFSKKTRTPMSDVLIHILEQKK